MKDDPAFAITEFIDDPGGIGTGILQHGGLTKRELFAMAAMQGMKLKHRGEYSENDFRRDDHLAHPEWVAGAALDYADALLAALEKERG